MNVFAFFRIEFSKLGPIWDEPFFPFSFKSNPLNEYFLTRFVLIQFVYPWIRMSLYGSKQNLESTSKPNNRYWSTNCFMSQVSIIWQVQCAIHLYFCFHASIFVPYISIIVSMLQFLGFFIFVDYIKLSCKVWICESCTKDSWVQWNNHESTERLDMDL